MLKYLSLTNSPNRTYMRTSGMISAIMKTGLFLVINSSNKCLQFFYFPVNDREIELATLWKLELQYYGKITCNF